MPNATPYTGPRSHRYSSVRQVLTLSCGAQWCMWRHTGVRASCLCALHVLSCVAWCFVDTATVNIHTYLHTHIRTYIRATIDPSPGRRLTAEPESLCSILCRTYDRTHRPNRTPTHRYTQTHKHTALDKAHTLRSRESRAAQISKSRVCL